MAEDLAVEAAKDTETVISCTIPHPTTRLLECQPEVPLLLTDRKDKGYPFPVQHGKRGMLQ